MGKAAKAADWEPEIVRSCFDLERFMAVAATGDVNDHERNDGSLAIAALSKARAISAEDQRTLRMMLAVGLTDDPKGAAQ